MVNSRRLHSFLFCKRRSLRAPFFLLGAWLAALLMLSSAGAQETSTPAPALQRYEFTRPEMGTVFKIKLFAASEPAAKEAAEAAFARVEALNQVCSDYLPDSELIRLCRARTMVVSDDLFRVLAAAQAISLRTDGAFDITVGHLTNLWRRSKRKGALPTEEQLAKAKALTGWQMLTLDDKTRHATLATPGMQLDLGGIAKGYAADEALAALKKHGIGAAVVAASGDLAIGDPPPGQTGWEIGVRSFAAAEAEDKKISLRLANCGISTSGDLRQFVEIGSQRYSHVIDPATGLGLTRRITCTVIAPNAMTSDGTDNAICVLGVEKGLAFVRSQPGLKVRIVTLDARGTVQTFGDLE